jgi:hypothetical protein
MTFLSVWTDYLGRSVLRRKLRRKRAGAGIREPEIVLGPQFAPIAEGNYTRQSRENMTIR